MKDLKHRLETFSIYDHSGIEKHLERMAEKGWLLKEIKRFTWVYHRMEPKKLHFAVTYYPKASDFDPEPLEGQMIYRDFSAHTGWIFVCQSGQMQIFFNEKEEPVPMETDPVIEVENVHRAVKKSVLLPYSLLLAISVLQIVMFFIRLSEDPARILSSTPYLAFIIAYILMFLLCAVELGGYFLWYFKAVKAAENGEFLETRSHVLFQKILAGIAVFILIYVITHLIIAGDRAALTTMLLSLIAFIICIAVLNGLKLFMKRKKVSRLDNFSATAIIGIALVFAIMTGIVIGILKAEDAGLFHPEAETYEYNGSTFILYQDELPLSVEDLQVIEFDGYIRENRQSESPLLRQEVVHQRPRYDTANYSKWPVLRYTVTAIKMPALYDICKKSVLNSRKDTVDEEGGLFINHYEEIDAAPWLAEKAYQLHWSRGILNSYVLCYEDRIIKIEFDWEPTVEQMKIVAEKLNP